MRGDRSEEPIREGRCEKVTQKDLMRGGRSEGTDLRGLADPRWSVRWGRTERADPRRADAKEPIGGVNPKMADARGLMREGRSEGADPGG